MRLRSSTLALAMLLSACAGTTTSEDSSEVAAGDATGGSADCRPTTDDLPLPVAADAGANTPFPWDGLDEVEVQDGFETAEVLPGGPPPDGILPIDTPCVVDVATADTWLADDESVLLVEVDDVTRAYPLAIMTQHEIVNDVLGDTAVVVTYCPLCNSGLAFVRELDGEAWDFGTSGRLYRSNLVMYDRQTRTLWSQFSGAAVWGDPDVVGRELERVPTQLLGWATVREAFPDAEVLGRDSVAGRSYGRNPYPGYDGSGSGFLFQGPLDAERLDPDARVVGLGEGEAAIAVPLDRLRDERVVTVDVDGAPVTLVWAPGQASALDANTVAEGGEVGQTGAFAVPGLELAEDGRFRDPASGAVHDVTGRTVEGDAPALQRVPLDDTFWFVWFAFQPDTTIAAG